MEKNHRTKLIAAFACLLLLLVFAPNNASAALIKPKIHDSKYIVNQQLGVTMPLSWDPVQGATSYKLYKDGVLVATLPSGTTSYTFAPHFFPYQDRRVDFGVIAVGSGTEQSDLETRSITTPWWSAPAPVMSAKQDGLWIDVSWNLGGDFPDDHQYYLYRQVNGGELLHWRTLSPSLFFGIGREGKTIDKEAIINSSYTYRMRAVTSYDGKTYYHPLSNPITINFTDQFTTAAPVLTNIYVYSSSNRIYWNGISGAAGYNVYVSVNGAPEQAPIYTTNKNIELGGAVPGNTYGYRVSAVAGNLESQKSNQLRGTTPGGSNQPESTVLNTANETAAGVSLAWEAVSGISRYVVYRSVNDSARVPLATVNATTFTDGNIAAGNKYGYSITSLNSSGQESAYSNSRSLIATENVTNVLATPVIQTTAASGTQVNLTFTVSPGATYYQVYRSLDGGTQVLLANTTTNTYLDKNLAYDSNYTYWVKAFNATYASDYSVPKTFRTGNAPPPLTAQTVPVLESLSIKGTSLVLTWREVYGATNYRVYRSVNGGNHVRFQTLGQVTTFTDTDVLPGNTYSYLIIATSGVIVSRSSANRALQLPMQKPALLTAVHVKTQVLLTWKAVPGASSYRLYRSSNGGNYVGFITLGQVTSYTDTGLSASNKYAYKVIAYNPDGINSRSSDALSATQPEALATPALEAVTATSSVVNLRWKAISGASNYVIYKSINGASYVKATTLGQVSSYADTAVSQGNRYAYRIAALDEYGVSTPLSAGKAVDMLLAKPVISSILQNGTTVSLGWAAVPGAISYKLYRSVNGGNHNLVATLGNSNTYTDTRLAPGTNYSYRVLALSASGVTSLTSDAKAVRMLGTPAITSLTINGTRANLKWTAVAGALDYQVFRVIGSGGFLHVGNTTITSFSIGGLKAGETVAYVIKARRGTDTSVLSPQKSAICLAAPTISRLTFNTATTYLTWQAVAGATQYQVYRAVNGGAFVPYNTASSVSFTDTGLTTGSTYQYRIVSKNANSTSGMSAIRGVKLFPTPVLLAISGGTSSASLRWGTIEGATEYVVYRSDNGGPYLWHALTSQPNFQESGLARETTYRYRVRARISYGLSPFSAYLEVKTPIVLGVPEISTISYSGNKISIQWLALRGANSYQVYRSVDGSAYTLYKSLGDTSSFTDSNLAYGSTYYYRIKAFATGTSSVLSNAKSATLLDTPVLSPITANGSAATLRWQVVKGTFRYQVYRQQGGGAFVHLDTVASNNYKDIKLDPGTTYHYVVKATNADSSSSLSAARSITPLPAPIISSLTNSTSNAYLNWSAVRSARSYQVYRSVNGSAWTLIGTVSGTSYTDQGLVNGRTYGYRIKAQNPESLSVLSDARSITASWKLNQPQVAASANGGTAYINWGTVSGASQYQVYRSQDGGGWTLQTTITGTSYNDSGLSGGSRYGYRVKAFSESANSDLSAPAYLSVLSKPATPSGVIAGDAIILTWASVPRATSYQLLYSKDNSEYVLLRTLSSTTANIGNLVSGSKYSFAVRALNDNAISVNSGVFHQVLP